MGISRYAANIPPELRLPTQEAMKRALGIFGGIGLTALISYLHIVRQQAQERAHRLDRTLQDAEFSLPGQ